MIQKLTLICIVLLFACDDKAINLLPEDNAFNFSDWKTVSGSWSFTDSILNQDSVGQPNAGLGYQICTGDNTWKNYTISFDVKSESVDWVGLFFRYTDQYNFCLFLLRNGNCELGSNSGASRNYTVLKTYTSALKKDTWYSVRANILDNVFQLYVNDVLYFKETNNFFKSGSIALGGKDASCFKNIKIQRL